MSLLQINDALCHWLAGHNVILDFLRDREPWPTQVAPIASLLGSSSDRSVQSMGDLASESSREDVEEAERRLEFVNTVCASAREWEKTRAGERFPWVHILAGLLEEVVPEAIT